MKKHVEFEHNALIKKNRQKQFHVATTISLSRATTKKWVHVTLSAISSFFYSTNQFKKDNESHVCFLEDVMLFVIKGYLSMKAIESIWL
jgi:hypothetical protein